LRQRSLVGPGTYPMGQRLHWSSPTTTESSRHRTQDQQQASWKGKPLRTQEPEAICLIMTQVWTLSLVDELCTVGDLWLLGLNTIYTSKGNRSLRNPRPKACFFLSRP
jgi:hypothetical protein